MSLSFIHLFDDGLGHSLYTFRTAVETLNHSLEGILGELLSRLVDILLTGEGHLHRQHMQELFLTPLVVTGVLDDVYHTVPDDVGDIHADTFSHECVATLLVDDRTLLVHHIIVLNQTLSDTEVVLLHLLLGTLDTLRDHRTLNHFTLFEA